MGKEMELLKIGELARRAGVNRGTVQHYLREGLLPRPVKTHRNMAWYDAGSVERIKVIKALQKERYLPLQLIKKIIAGRSAGAQVKAQVEAQQAALSSLALESPQASALTHQEAAQTFDMPRKLIQKLEQLGLVGSYQRPGGDRVFAGPDLEVLASVAQLKRLGFTEGSGFKPDDLLVYKKTIEGLLDQEMAMFLNVVVGKKSPDDASKMARAGVNGGTALLVALRKKLIVDLLATAGVDTVDRVLAGGPVP